MEDLTWKRKVREQVFHQNVDMSRTTATFNLIQTNNSTEDKVKVSGEIEPKILEAVKAASP